MGHKVQVCTIFAVLSIYLLHACQSIQSKFPSFAGVLVTYIVVILFIHFYGSSKGFSLIDIIRELIDIQCYKKCFTLACFVMMQAWIAVAAIVVALNSTNAYTSEIVELVSVAMTCLSLMILSDLLIIAIGMFHEPLLYISSSYTIKLWFVWQLIVLIGSAQDDLDDNL